MKYILTALFLAGLISCKDDTVSSEGELSVLLNGEDFLSQFTSQSSAGLDEGCYDNRFVLSSRYQDQEGIERIVFAIVGIPLEEGTYIIHRKEINEDRCLQDVVDANFHTLVSDGDVLGDAYLPVETEDNHIVLTSYNEDTREIEGTFQMTLAVELEDHRPQKTVIDAPDTIQLTDGKFKATLE